MSLSRRSRNFVVGVYSLVALSLVLVPSERQRHVINLQVLEAKSRVHGLTAQMHAEVARQCAVEARWWSDRAVRARRSVIAAAGISAACGTWLALMLWEWLR